MTYTQTEMERRQSPMQVEGDQTASTINIGRGERWASIAAGAGLIGYGTRRGPFGWLLSLAGSSLVYRGVTGHCHLVEAMGVNRAIVSDSRMTSVPHRQGAHVREAVTVARPIDQVYSFWRDLANFPRFMKHVRSVEVLDDRRSRWTAVAPAGTSVSWEAEIVNEIENHLIAWRSLEGAEINHAGSVRFKAAPGGRGTEVHFSMEYVPPAGRLGTAVARMFGEEPSIQVYDDLRRFKSLMETGEIPTTLGQTSGRSELVRR